MALRLNVTDLSENWVEEEGNNIKKISVFNNHFCPTEKMTPFTLENNLQNKAEWYILQNCSEIEIHRASIHSLKLSHS